MNTFSSMSTRPTSAPRGPGVMVLEDGARLRARALRQSDEGALRAAFHALSPESRYHRFMGHVPDLSGWMWRYLCHVDARDHVALAAFTHDERRIVGVARFIRSRDEPSVAEVAVTIADDWPRRGLGTRLLAQLADRARGVGITTFVAYAFANNSGIHRLLAKVGPVTASRVGAETILFVQLSTP